MSKLTTLGTYAFEHCTALTGAYFENLKSIPSYCFYYCSNLKSYYYGDIVTKIGEYAFSHCNSLYTAGTSNDPHYTILNFDSATYIGNYAFEYCSSITAISLRGLYAAGAYILYNCSALINIDFSEKYLNVTSYTYLNTYAFSSINSNAGTRMINFIIGSVPTATNMGAFVLTLLNSGSYVYIYIPTGGKLSTYLPSGARVYDSDFKNLGKIQTNAYGYDIYAFQYK
jgi:hypothetical protein